MTGMMGLPNSGVYVCGVSQNPSQGFLYSWTRGTSASAPSVTRAGASPYPFGPGSGIYDVKAQTVGSRTHIYAGGFAVALGGGFIWHFQHIGPAGAMTMPPPTEWPFMPYAAPGLPWVNDLPVYGLDVTRPYMTASGLAPGVVYGTGQHSLGGGPNGVSGQIAMKVESPGLPSWSLMPPFPASGTGRLVVGHTIRWAGPQIFSHGNGTLDSGGSYTSDGEVMSFTP